MGAVVEEEPGNGRAGAGAVVGIGGGVGVSLGGWMATAAMATTFNCNELWGKLQVRTIDKGILGLLCRPRCLVKLAGLVCSTILRLKVRGGLTPNQEVMTPQYSVTD